MESAWLTPSYQVAALQGYLLKNKTRPSECVDEVGEWVIKERETRAKLKKEKEEVRAFIAMYADPYRLFRKKQKRRKRCADLFSSITVLFTVHV